MRNLIYIYSKYLNKKKKYYFRKYLSKVVKPKNFKLCTCQYSSFYNDSEPVNTSINTHINNNFSTSHEYNKLNNKILNVKIQDFIINKENSNIYSNFVNLNKSEYFYNGNEIGSFSSFNNINNENPTKNIISVKNGINNKKYVVKIKLYGNQANQDETDNNIMKYKENINNENKNKKFVKKIYSYKNNNMMKSNINYPDYLKKSNKDNFHGLLTNSFYLKKYNNTLNPTFDMKCIDNTNYNKIMNDQEILDYLNTNNTEKKNLIKKILNQKNLVGNRQFMDSNKISNKKKIYLNKSTTYSYENNNYFYNQQTSLLNTNTNTNENTLNKRVNYSYKYYNNYTHIENNNNSKNSNLIPNKKMRSCNSNVNLFHGNLKNLKNEEKKKMNCRSLNHTKTLKKVNSSNYIQNNCNINTNKNNNTSNTPRITPFPCPKNILSPIPKIILLNNKNKLKHSESSNRIINKKQKINSNQNTLTINSKYLNKQKESVNGFNLNINREKEKKKNNRTKIPNSNYIKSSNSLESNIININIDDLKNKNRFLAKNVVDENFIKNMKMKHSVTNTESENLEISVQSLNDSKIMELAKNYIKQEDNLNHNEINQILNSKKSLV